MYDFSKLTERQQELLTYEGWQPGQLLPRQPTPGIVRKLLDRGLLVPRETTIGRVKVTAYDVPRDVHAAWCAHCAAQKGGDRADV